MFAVIRARVDTASVSDMLVVFPIPTISGRRPNDATVLSAGLEKEFNTRESSLYLLP